jgi:hypothetical protein
MKERDVLHFSTADCELGRNLFFLKTHARHAPSIQQWLKRNNGVTPEISIYSHPFKLMKSASLEVQKYYTFT